MLLGFKPSTFLLRLLFLSQTLHIEGSSRVFMYFVMNNSFWTKPNVSKKKKMNTILYHANYRNSAIKDNINVINKSRNIV